MQIVCDNAEPRSELGHRLGGCSQRPAIARDGKREQDRSGSRPRYPTAPCAKVGG